jgi:hypothetical protein
VDGVGYAMEVGRARPEVRHRSAAMRKKKDECAVRKKKDDRAALTISKPI